MKTMAKKKTKHEFAHEIIHDVLMPPFIIFCAVIAYGAIATLLAVAIA